MAAKKEMIELAYLEFTRITQTGITVRLAGLDLTGQRNMGTGSLPRHNSYRISCIGDVRGVSKGSGGYSGSVTYSGLAPDTVYEFAGLVNYTDAKGGTHDVYIQDTCATQGAPPPLPERPEDWAWRSEVAPDRPIMISAEEWTAFYDRINAFRKYKGQEPWTAFYPVARGTPISAEIIRETLAAIQPISPAPMPPVPVAGKTVITAEYFHQLKAYLNSVP